MNNKALLLVGGIALVGGVGFLVLKGMSSPNRSASFNRSWGPAYFGSDYTPYQGRGNTAWGPAFYGGFGNGVQMKQKPGNIWTPSLLEGR